MAIQQHRIVRFLMILGAVLLTIFIYASYYSNLTMTIPTTRIQHQQQQQQQSAAASSSLSTLNNNFNNNNNNNNNNLNSNSYINNDDSSGLINKNPNSIFVVADKQNIDKIQLINSGQEKTNINRTFYVRQQQQQQNDDSNMSSSNSIAVTNSSSSLQSSSTISNNFRRNSNLIDLTKKSVISTTTTNNSSSSVFSTLQKQNENNQLVPVGAGASSSLSSSSTLSSSSPQSSLSSSVQLGTAQKSEGRLNLANNHQQQPPSPPSSSSNIVVSSSSVSSIQPLAVSQPQQQQQQKSQSSSSSSSSSTDTSKGISTISIYEKGHLDVNPLLCRDEGESLRLFIAITSAPTHREARLAIRQTWGHYGTRRDVSIAFILGRTTNQQIEESLTSENYLYGDLIRGHFIDSYNNLTLKTISALEWVDKYCPQVTYVLKTDDDMFINVPKLLSFIDKHQNDKHVIYGRLAKKWKPIRNKKSKYYVSPGQFSLTVFPQFTTGPAYLLSSDIIHDLYLKSLEQTYLKLEDVYTTGIVAQLLNIKRIHVNEFLNRRIAFNPCNIRKAISVHMIKSNEQFDLWKKLLDTTTKCK